MAKKTTKGANGTGDTVTIYFDQTDPAERRALEAARLLATKHGRRKQVIIAVLEAIYREYEQHGELPTVQEISARIAGNGQTGALMAPSAAPPAARKNLVEITTGGRTSAEEVAKNFIKSAGAAFFD